KASVTQFGLIDLAPLLERAGIRCAPWRLAESAGDAAAAAQCLGFPVALKICSPDISHKTDVGGVRLGLRSAEEGAAAATAMLERVRAERPAAAIAGLLVQRMADRGKELLLGMVWDPQFGPALLVGFGGVYAEVLKDTAMRLAPLAKADALEMLD